MFPSVHVWRSAAAIIECSSLAQIEINDFISQHKNKFEFITCAPRLLGDSCIRIFPRTSFVCVCIWGNRKAAMWFTSKSVNYIGKVAALNSPATHQRNTIARPAGEGAYIRTFILYLRLANVRLMRACFEPKLSVNVTIYALARYRVYVNIAHGWWLKWGGKRKCERTTFKIVFLFCYTQLKPTSNKRWNVQWFPQLAHIFNILFSRTCPVIWWCVCVCV